MSVRISSLYLHSYGSVMTKTCDNYITSCFSVCIHTICDNISYITSCYYVHIYTICDNYITSCLYISWSVRLCALAVHFSCRVVLDNVLSVLYIYTMIVGCTVILLCTPACHHVCGYDDGCDDISISILQ